MKLFSSICTVLILTLCAVAALAADLAPPHAAPETVAGLGTLLQQTVFPVIGAFLLGLISLALKWVGRKFKLESLVQENNILMDLAHQGITLAEERSAQLMDSRVPLTGQNKLAIAIGHVLSVMPKVSEERARNIVESMLAQIPGAGATGKTIYPRQP